MTVEPANQAGKPASQSGSWIPWRVFLLVAAVWSACFAFPRVWSAMGITESQKPFLDLEGLLASGEAAQRGLDPYLPNPLDIFHRPHVYTKWWLVTGKLGLTRADTPWLGAVLTGLVLLSAVLLARPRDARQGWLLGLTLVSPALLMAVNRGNNDLVAFILMCGAFALLRRVGNPPRLLGVMLLALAAVLKYYPLAAAVVLLDARTRREWLGWVLAYALVVAVAWPGLVPGLHSAAKYRPSPDWLYAFGAPVVFRDFSLATPPGWLLLGGGLALAVWFARTGWTDPAGGASTPAAEREFAAAAAMMVGCFALGSSYAYKLVFCLWLLPWLWRDTPPGKKDHWRKAALGLLLAVLWLEGLVTLVINLLIAPVNGALALNTLKVTLLASQLLEWGLVIVLLRGLFVYTGRRLARLGRGTA